MASSYDQPSFSVQGPPGSNLDHSWIMGLSKLLIARQHINTSSETHSMAAEPPANIKMMEYFQYLKRTIPRDNLKLRKHPNVVRTMNQFSI